MKSFQRTITRTFTPKWVKMKFTTFSNDYVNIRKGFHYQGYRCFKCDHKFELNEVIALACIENVGNKTFCQSCAAEIAGE